MSFSKIDLSMDKEEIIKKLPKYAKVVGQKNTVTVRAGEMLYLPASWFHNVTSKSDPKLNSHFAINWWLHPTPYCDDFWEQYTKSILNKNANCK